MLSSNSNMEASTLISNNLFLSIDLVSIIIKVLTILLLVKLKSDLIDYPILLLFLGLNQILVKDYIVGIALLYSTFKIFQSGREGEIFRLNGVTVSTFGITLLTLFIFIVNLKVQNIIN